MSTTATTAGHVFCVGAAGYLVVGPGTRCRRGLQPVIPGIDLRHSIRMRFIDIFSLVLSLLGVYGIVYSLRLLLPRNIVPLVSTSLNETMSLLEHAEAINIPNMSDNRANLAMYARDCTPNLY